MITLPTAFINSSGTNQTDLICLAHLYYDASNYLKFCTEADTTALPGYMGCLDASSIQWSAKWDISGTNKVTLSVPEIILQNETYPDNSDSVVSMLMSSGCVGGRAVLLIGYKGHTVATDFVTIYDGKTEDVTFTGSKITLTLTNSSLPSTPINGRQINNRLIGTDDYSASITIPDESDGRYLPVPFGNQWNSPCVLYRGTEEDSTYWAYHDNAWHADFNATYLIPLAFKRDNVRDAGTQSTPYVMLVPNEGALVTIYSTGYKDATMVLVGTDASAGNLRYLRIVGPNVADSQALYGQRYHVNVPLRMYRDSNAAATFTNIAATVPTDADLDKILTGDIGEYVTASQNVDGTTSRIVFNAVLDYVKQLRSSSNFSVNPNWPIHIPQPDNPTDDGYTMLLMGVFSFDRAGSPDEFVSRNFIHSFRIGKDPLAATPSTIMPATSDSEDTFLDAWAGGSYENYIGCTFVGRILHGDYPPGSGHWYNQENGGQDAGYHYYTHTYAHDAGSDIAGGNELDLANDRVGIDQVADAGNLEGRHPESNQNTISAAMGDRPFLRRNALDEGVGFRINMMWNDTSSGTADVTATFKALYWEAFEDIAFDWDEDKYTPLRGWVDSDYAADSLVTITGSETPAGFANEAYKILEVIIRRKVGAASTDMNGEWANIPLAYADMFSSDRTGSGFVTPTDEELPFDEFIEEYCKHEPFTVYIDTSGKYRFLMFPVNSTSYGGRTYFTAKTDGADYSWFDTFEMGLTDKQFLCSQVDNCMTDRIYFDGSYVENHKWKIPSATYSYSYWDKDNSESSNKYRKEEIEKRFTSHVTPSRVANASDSTKGYNCLLSNSGTSIPLVRAAEGDIKYWTPLAGDSSDWGSLTSYTASGQAGSWVGWDSENRAVASYWLNQWCNRHRVIRFTTRKLSLMKFEIGDLIYFSGVPDTLLGLSVGGFNATALGTSATVNGQTVYDRFLITSINKTLTTIEIEAIQLHNLGQFIVDRKIRKPRHTFDRKTGPSIIPQHRRKPRRNSEEERG